MIDIYKQIDYWRISAEEDWVVAKKLIADESLRHGLFFAHLTLEKILKALVCQATQNLAPRIHSLTRLAEIASLSMHVDYARILGEMNDFNLIGRYPEFDQGILTVVEAHYYMKRTEEVYQWLVMALTARLSK
ncbi:MAG: HEPN domain-containing protein [Chloroflexi bacterium]|nr:HEPN domain-containing protein [Chloroflexota bacterium]